MKSVEGRVAECGRSSVANGHSGAMGRTSLQFVLNTVKDITDIRYPYAMSAFARHPQSVDLVADLGYFFVESLRMPRASTLQLCANKRRYPGCRAQGR